MLRLVNELGYKSTTACIAGALLPVQQSGFRLEVELDVLVRLGLRVMVHSSDLLPALAGWGKDCR